MEDPVAMAKLSTEEVCLGSLEVSMRKLLMMENGKQVRERDREL